MRIEKQQTPIVGPKPDRSADDSKPVEVTVELTSIVTDHDGDDRTTSKQVNVNSSSEADHVEAKSEVEPPASEPIRNNNPQSANNDDIDSDSIFPRSPDSAAPLSEAGPKDDPTSHRAVILDL